MTPLQQAAYKGNSELCSFLIEQGADVNTLSHKHKYSPLMFAALSGLNSNLIRFILSITFHANSSFCPFKEASKQHVSFLKLVQPQTLKIQSVVRHLNLQHLSVCLLSVTTLPSFHPPTFWKSYSLEFLELQWICLLLPIPWHNFKVLPRNNKYN